MSQNKFYNCWQRYKQCRTLEAFFLFETIMAMTIFMTVIVGILGVVNFSNKSFRQSLERFNALCSVSDFYHQNMTKAKHTGDIVYFGGVAFYKVAVETEKGTKYVFFKK